jgi:DNA-binding NtrC family response regulator
VTTILVAEDDDGVRQLILVTLRRSGHTVIAAANGGEAMAVLEQPDVVVDLLVSDVHMPGVGGLELVAFARTKRPGMPAILASGTNRWQYPPDRIDRDVTLLEKPFSIKDLDAAVAAALVPGQAMIDAIPATKTDMAAEGDDGQVFGG